MATKKTVLYAVVCDGKVISRHSTKASADSVAYSSRKVLAKMGKKGRVSIRKETK